MAFDPESHPKRSEQVRWQVVDEDGILVNLDSGFYFSMNPVALFIWNLCDGNHSANTILAEIISTFDVDESTARRDLQAFLTQLEAESLLEISQGTTG